MNDSATTFRKLLHPIDPLTFLSDHYGTAPLHVPGKQSKVKPVCSWADFSDLMSMTALWSGETLKLVLDGKTIPPESYCRTTAGRDGVSVQRPDYNQVAVLLSEGATVVADLVETLSSGIRTAATALEMGVGAHVTCNAYMSQHSRQAFPSHFDTMEVFALQIEGRKVWRVYEGRFAGPMERPGYCYPYFPQEYHERAKGEVLLEVELQPGDLLYIPAGVYHDALASSEACLHLSFGVTHPTVADYFSWLTRSLEDVDAFRECLPDYSNPSNLGERLERAEQKLSEMLAKGAARSQFDREMKRQAHRLLSPVAVPPEKAERYYRVPPFEVRKDGAVWLTRTVSGERPLDDDLALIARWLQERDLATEGELHHRMRKVPGDDAVRKIDQLVQEKLLIPI